MICPGTNYNNNGARSLGVILVACNYYNQLIFSTLNLSLKFLYFFLLNIIYLPLPLMDLLLVCFCDIFQEKLMKGFALESKGLYLYVTLTALQSSLFI